jgi:hypothetical protein
VTPVPRNLPVALPVTLAVLPELADHTIQGKSTVPAALLLDLLVRHATEQNAHAATFPLVMRDAVFPRFLPADEVERCTFETSVEETLAEDATAGTRATLTSRIALAGGISRTRTHAAASLGGPMPSMPLPPAEIACDIEISALRVYDELIPFGPRYRNLHDEIRLGREGGTGWVRSPEPPSPQPSRAGCPYLFDSAMHLACLWGQRYAGVVAYPIGFSARVIASPLAHGQRRCVVAPRTVDSRALTFDLWLTDENHAVCDTILGLAMAPLARGARPPAWIVAPQASHHTP